MKLINVTPQQEGNSIIYLKPDTTIVRNNEDFYIPEFSNNISTRVALVIKVKKIGKNISQRFANRYYDEVGVGLSLEASDILAHNKSQGLPWDDAVGFDKSAPLSPFIPKEDTNTIQLILNQESVQEVTISSDEVDKIIAECSTRFTLKIGDFIYITPSSDHINLQIGHQLHATLNKKSLLDCNIK